MTNPWDQRFSRSADYLYGETPNAWIASALPKLPVGAQVLALADGEGRNAVWLAEQGYAVLNCDYSQIGLAKTQQLAAQRGVVVATQHTDLTACTLPEAQFDAVVASFFHLPHVQQAQVWENVIKAIKPSGYLVVQVFSREQLPLNSGGPKDESLLYQLSDWQHFLRDMHVEILEATEVVLDEGELHQGVAKVINIKSVKKESCYNEYR
jgi:2-polyprenyl-3-methyl-5-hydroxy-6-metoxy-1,4-benzoquinol methylase